MIHNCTLPTRTIKHRNSKLIVPNLPFSFLLPIECSKLMVAVLNHIRNGIVVKQLNEKFNISGTKRIPT